MKKALVMSHSHSLMNYYATWESTMPVTVSEPLRKARYEWCQLQTHINFEGYFIQCMVSNSNQEARFSFQMYITMKCYTFGTLC